MLNFFSRYRKVKSCCDQLVYYSDIQNSYKLGSGNARVMKLSKIITTKLK